MFDSLVEGVQIFASVVPWPISLVAIFISVIGIDHYAGKLQSSDTKLRKLGAALNLCLSFSAFGLFAFCITKW